MSRLGLMGKMLMLALVPLVLTLVVVFSGSIYFKNQTLDQQVDTFTQDLRAQKMKQVKDAVTIALASVRNQIQAQPDRSPLQVVEETLSKVTFGDGGYFFVYNLEGTVQFHGLKPQTKGQNQLHLKDPNGTPFIAELVKAAKAGGGTASYFYQKPGATGLVEKISYVEPLNEYGWLLGTGVYVDEIDSAVTAFRGDAQAMSDKETLTTSVLALGILVLAVLAILYVSRRTVAPVNAMLVSLQEIAQGEGDLTKRLDVKGQDEIAQLGEAFNRFTSKLQQTMSEVAEATEQVGMAVDSINDQTASISRQLSVHDDETEQVVTAVTEMSMAAAEIAGNANQMAGATQAAADDAGTAQDKVGHSVSSINALVDEVDLASQHIDRLNEQSTKIHSVLGVIGDIADQTNLLALNAAIEAARAGDQGRGFAVVADEVRTLAKRTQESTTQIHEIIDSTQKRAAQAQKVMDLSQEAMGATVTQAQKSGEAMASILAGMEQIADMATHIASATEEQSTVTSELSRTITEIHTTGDEVLAGSRQTAGACEELTALAHGLTEMTGKFTTA